MNKIIQHFLAIRRNEGNGLGWKEVIGQVQSQCQKISISERNLSAKHSVLVDPLLHGHLQALINNVIPQLSAVEMHKGYSQIVEISEGAKRS